MVPAGLNQVRGSFPRVSDEKNNFLATRTRANPALWPEEPGSFPSWGEAAAKSREEAERTVRPPLPRPAPEQRGLYLTDEGHQQRRVSS